MSVDEPSFFARAFTWLVLALTIILIVLSISWYGWSMEIRSRLRITSISFKAASRRVAHIYRVARIYKVRQLRA
jgi:hypothetical protein